MNETLIYWQSVAKRANNLSEWKDLKDEKGKAIYSEMNFFKRIVFHI